MCKNDPIKVYDARWEDGEFSDEEITRLFEAAILYGMEQGADTLFISRDARLGCAQVMELGIARALTAGFRVFACTDPISTPASYFFTQRITAEHPNTMGLCVTASHNPAKYVGIKFTIPPVSAIGYDCGPDGGLTRVREIYHGDETLTSSSKGSLKLCNFTDDYIRYGMERSVIREGSLRGLSVIIDSFHGSAGPEVFRALEDLGVQVTARNLIPDGRFPSGSPNPTSHGKMGPAVDMAKKLRPHVVIGIDGDGDRIVFGDHRGILNAGFAALPILKADSMLPGTGGGKPVLFDPKVNPIALREWKALGADPVLFRNGHSQIKEYMERKGAPFAAEESGHYFHKLDYRGVSISAEHTLVTVFLFLESVKNDPRLMDALWVLQDSVYTTGEINYQFPDDGVRDKALDWISGFLKKQNAELKTRNSDGIDLQGIQVNRGVIYNPEEIRLDRNWYSGYIRTSTNEKGIVRLFFSAEDGKTGSGILSEIVQFLKDTYGGVQVE